LYLNSPPLHSILCRVKLFLVSLRSDFYFFCEFLVLPERTCSFRVCMSRAFAVSYRSIFISFRKEIFSLSLVGAFFLSLSSKTDSNLCVFT
jgi:hypothetical protein